MEILMNYVTDLTYSCNNQLESRTNSSNQLDSFPSSSNQLESDVSGSKQLKSQFIWFQNI